MLDTNTSFWKITNLCCDDFISISKDEIEMYIKNGADLKIVLKTENYDEILPINSICIQKDVISGLVDHHLTLPFDKTTYNVLLTYTLDNQFIILRIPHLTGEHAENIPNIGFHPSGYYKSYKWITTDRWIKVQCDLKNAFESGGETKLRITCNNMIFFARKSIFIQYHNGNYSIRTRLVSIPYNDHIDLVNFNITQDKLQQKIYRFYKHPKQFSKLWMQQKFKKLFGKSLFETIYSEYDPDQFAVEIYKSKPDYF